MERIFATEDLQLISKMETLLNRTLTRGNKIANLTDSFSQELKEFDNYLKEISHVKTTEKQDYDY